MTSPSIVNAPAPAKRKTRAPGSLESFGALVAALKSGQAVECPWAGATPASNFAQFARGLTGRPYRAYRAENGKFYLTIDAE